MSSLVLKSLEIKNFRGFRHLQIEHLGRVNLIVGKNNIGKSSLLEALQLYTQRGNPTLIQELLRVRDEGKRSSSNRNTEVEDMLVALKYLFYGRKDVRSVLEPTIHIGPIESPDEVLSIAVGWYLEQFEDSGVKRRLLGPEEYKMADNPIPRFNIQLGKQPIVTYPLKPRLLRTEIEEIACVFASSNGLSNSHLSIYWDNISLRDLEKEVITALQIIAPGVEGVSIIGDPESSRGRIPIVKIVGIDEPLPLRSLGDGMQRMLGIALALANAKDGMLLIDEIENGIHYSVQGKLWELVFRLAHYLNVQVFATTHSGDCIEAFQKAAQEDTQTEGTLIRLESRKGEIGATLFDEEELAIVTREQIEVR
jgi:ABC-type transport system involved in cytochrome c biogenesis ATPase subunit